MSARAPAGVCRFIFSADLHVLVRCRIDRLLPQAQAEELIGDEPLDIEVDLLLDGELFRTVQSSQAVFDASPEKGFFRPQQFVFALKVRDLPRNSVLRLRLRAQTGRLYFGDVALFGPRAALQQGRQLVQLAPEGGVPAPVPRAALELRRALDLHARGWLPQAAPGFEGSEDFFARAAQEALEACGPWLSLHLPCFPHPVVFAEPAYSQDIEVPAGVVAAPRAEEVGAGLQEALLGPAWLLRPDGQRGGFKKFLDGAGAAEHPAVLKDLRLARSSRASRVKDRDARPTADELRRLNELVRRPRRQLGAEERHLLFKFRWSLLDQPGALPRFLHAVDWSDLEERGEAIELLSKWSPVDIDDALELLSKDFRGVREVRGHAVARLESATDAELQLYLLQLVQALRYEPQAHEEEEEEERGERESHSLTSFLVRRAAGCRALLTLFYWYVQAEADDRERGSLFERVRQQLLEALNEGEGPALLRMLERQQQLRHQLLWAVQQTKQLRRASQDRKLERFRRCLASEPEGPRLDLLGGLDEAVPLPVDPSVALVQVYAEQSFLLKSAMAPAVLCCKVREEGGKGESLKRIMVKEGDDLRQDQLVLQLVILMDSILKKYGLDMQLTTYQVIALSTSDGFVEFVPDASNLSTVLKDHNGDIQQFFRAHHPLGEEPPAGGNGPGNSYGIKPEVLETFVRSCAGYCVITYLLGIGDRHLDNLMVTRDGRLFHIDFGFILGKDPKPFPPPMRICKEMVEGMGGNSSPGYQSFKSKCCQAYKILRRHAKLIINLLYLMTDSGIKDLCGDPQFAILKVEQKFQALMDDEQAEEHFLKLIDDSVSALFPVMMEKLHRISVAMQ